MCVCVCVCVCVYNAHEKSRAQYKVVDPLLNFYILNRHWALKDIYQNLFFGKKLPSLLVIYINKSAHTKKVWKLI